MIYVIKGVDKNSGADRVLRINAADERAALLQASGQGLMVEKVRAERSAPAQNEMIDPLPMSMAVQDEEQIPGDDEQALDGPSTGFATANSELVAAIKAAASAIETRLYQINFSLEETRGEVKWISLWFKIVFALLVISLIFGILSVLFSVGSHSH